MLDALHNASLLERPLDKLTLSSAATACVRDRRRQYEVRDYVAQKAEAASVLESVVASRTHELEQANEILRTQMAEREKIEEALRQSQKMEAVGQLTGGLAHDFNNMLTGVIGGLEMIQTRIAQGRVTELDRYVNTAASSAQRAAALTHRLLAFSRRQTLSPKPTDANALIDGMADLIRNTVGPAISVRITRPDALWTTLCDPNQLESALLNLVINARDAMPNGGELTIGMSNAQLGEAQQAALGEVRAGEYVALTVADTGTGMSEQTVARVFDPFYTTKPMGEGTGLGLSMVYGFARQSAGYIRVESELGRGTTICLYLPRSEGPAEAGPPAPAADPPRASPGETVLVVDDEATIRMLVQEVLAELGYAALEAENGKEGLRILKAHHSIDLLVTDVGLPGGMNGRQLADAARVERPDLRVLFITGYAETAAIGNGRLAPGLDVITKPFALRALASKIREMMPGQG
jgi:signal transduction histidine kinase